MSSTIVPVDDDSRVAEVRRLASECARAESLSEEHAGAAAVVATEIASNLRKHARGGEIQISRLSSFDSPGVEVLGTDRGPGMSDLGTSLQDGVSTAGTPGTGLGAVRRLSQVFDIYSQPGRGTVVLARIQPRRENTFLRLGAVCAPMKGETVCGDTWAAHRMGEVVRLFVGDGLGHGLLAADAALAAKRIFQESSLAEPEAALDRIHTALRATRGAAVAVTTIASDGRIRHAGLGNINGVIIDGSRSRTMLSHNGTAGHSARRIQQFEYSIAVPGVIVLHSDGLLTNWSLDAYPGLSRRHPALIAGALYRDASRGRDDICVVAASL